MSEIVKRHYDQLLADVYSWMYGGFDSKYIENLHFFNEHGIKPSKNGYTLDLGSGSGFQSVPLNDLGFTLVSVDISEKLCSELGARINDRKIEIRNSDILDFLKSDRDIYEVIVCMGDTITHFSTKENFSQSIKLCSEKLIPDGTIVLTFRDYSVELTGVSRFIPVKSDEDRIFTCFLEYAPDKLLVYDILNFKNNNKWEHKISVYPKLRLSAEWVKQVLEENDLHVTWFDMSKGFVRLIARKT